MSNSNQNNYNKINEAKSLAGNLLWNSFGTVFYFGCQWLLTVFVVHFHGGYSDAGILALALSVSSPLLIVSNLNLRIFQVSEMKGEYSDGDFLANRILASGVSFSICLVFVIYEQYEYYECLCIITFMLYKISESLADVLHGVAQKSWRLDIAGKSFIMRGIVILLSIACGVFLDASLFLIILLLVFCSYPVVLFYDFYQCKKLFNFNLSYQWKNVKSLLKIGTPLATYSVLLNLISIFPRFQIEAQYGKECLGIFASIATPTVLIPQLASLVFNPLMGTFAECRNTQDKTTLWKLLILSIAAIVGVGAIAVIAGNFLGEWTLVLLFGESIRNHAYLLVPIIYTAILTALIWLLCGLLTVFSDYHILAIFTFASFLFCLIFSPSLIAERQLMGVVLVLLLSLLLETLLLSTRLIYLLLREKLL